MQTLGLKSDAMSDKTTEAPSAEQYATAIRAVSLTDSQLRMLRIHYGAPLQTVTATQMAESLGYTRYSIANAHYGRIGRLVGDKLEYNPMKERLGTLVTFQKRNDEWHWIMRPQLAEALEILHLVKPGSPVVLPEEITESESSALVEGAVSRITVNAYERNPKARRKCIDTHGHCCCICGFDFGTNYGEVAKGYIHVHHLRSLAEIGAEYEVDPTADLRPVCPNCHAVLHLRNPPYTIEEVQALLSENKIAQQCAPADHSTAARFRVG